eukprot:231723-Pyramimonas_sp.AAC.1
MAIVERTAPLPCTCSRCSSRVTPGATSVWPLSASCWPVYSLHCDFYGKGYHTIREGGVRQVSRRATCWVRGGQHRAVRRPRPAEGAPGPDGLSSVPRRRA